MAVTKPGASIEWDVKGRDLLSYSRSCCRS